MDRAFISNRVCGGEAERTAFDGFDVIASPLGEFSDADRGRRVWKAPGATWGTTYGSHAIKLAVEQGERGRGLFILMQHGGGRGVLSLYTGPDWQAMRDAFLAMDERTLYAVLYSVWETAERAQSHAESATASKWAHAYQDGRIRKRRRAGRVSIYVETEFERDLRTGKTSPGRVAINTATGEMTAA